MADQEYFELTDSSEAPVRDYQSGDKALVVNGNGVAMVDMDSAQVAMDARVEELRGWIAGRDSYTTLALATATGITTAAVEVTNDPTESNNGIWIWDDGSLIKSAFDPILYAEALTKSGRRIVVGRITKKAWTPGASIITVSVSDGVSYIQSNSGQPEHAVAAVSDVTLSPGWGLIVNFDTGATDADGKFVPVVQKISSGTVSGWQDGNAVVLCVNGGSGALAGAYTLDADVENIGVFDGIGVFTLDGSAPTYNATSRTLTWPTLIILRADQRIKLDAGSCVFPGGNYWIAALDKTAIDYTLTPSSAVSVSRYTDGGWSGGEDQIPLFAVNQDLAYELLFPPTKGSANVPSVSKYSATEVVVITTETTISAYVKGSNPSTNQYIRWRWDHVTDAAIASDVWRLTEIWETTRTSDETFTDVRMLVRAGEHEVAIRETYDSQLMTYTESQHDFVGGNSHGNQILDSVMLMVDGVVKPLGVAQVIHGQVVELIQASTLYQRGRTLETLFDQSVVLSNLRTRWRLDSDHVDLWFKNSWISSASLDFAYYGMLSVLRDSNGEIISDTGYRSFSFEPEDISSSGHTLIVTDDEAVKLSGQVGASFEVCAMRGWSHAGRTLKISNSPIQNKIYPSFRAGSVNTGEYDEGVVRYYVTTTS